MSSAPDPTPPVGEGGTLEERAREIIWDIAVWDNDAAEENGAGCTWDYAQEYECEMGDLVPRTIDAAREVHAIYADEIAHLRAEVARLTAERDAAEARAARAEELVSLLVPDLLEDMAESIERRQPDLYGYTNEHGGTVSIALYLCGLADRVRALTEGADRDA